MTSPCPALLYLVKHNHTKYPHSGVRRVIASGANRREAAGPISALSPREGGSEKLR